MNSPVRKLPADQLPGIYESPNPEHPIRLDRYDNSWFHPGRSMLWRAAWLWMGLPLFRSSLLPFSGLRVGLLRLFGAKVGEGVVIHSEVVIKYPWHLVIGDHCWLGERAWIDNLTTVTLEGHVCLSQAAYLCTGNHNWSDPAFGLRVSSITLRKGSWAGARSTLLPGTVLEPGAVAGAGSVVSGTIPAFAVWSGNPAVFSRTRRVGAAVEQPAQTIPSGHVDEPRQPDDLLSKDDQPMLDTVRISRDDLSSSPSFPRGQEASTR